MNNTESLPVTLYYDLFSRVNAAAETAAPMIASLKKETRLLLDALADDSIRIAILTARLTAVKEAYPYSPIAGYIHYDINEWPVGDGFRKWEGHTEIIFVIDWLKERGIQADEKISEQQYELLKGELEKELVQYAYVNAATSYLEAEIWTLEGRIALAAGYKADTGLRWNLTLKPPYTKTDFENLMSALWEKKFITHTSGKKEQAMKALYGVFDLPVPEKIGTNRHKAKAAGTTSDNSYDIFDRLKAAHEQYLNAETK